MTLAAPAWELSSLVETTEPAAIRKELERLTQEAEALASAYRGKVESLDAEGLLRFLRRLEDHFVEREGVLKYASLRYAANALDPDAKGISDWARRASAKMRQALAFDEIEIGRLLQARPEFVGDPALKGYRHYLERVLRTAPHLLSEAEEQLVIQKDRFGIDAWYQIQGDWLSTRTFEVEVEGERKVMPYGEVVGLYEHPDREVRREANRVVYDALGQDEILWASALRSVAGDHLEMAKKRGWPDPLEPSLVANDVDRETIDALMATVEAYVDLYRRYLRFKARLLGLPKLGNWDVVAPLPGASERTFSWDEAREMVVRAYEGFDPELGDLVDTMFAGDRIDGAVRKGKRSGAFCASWYGGRSAFVLLSYNGRLGEVFTLAHENGHAIHDALMARSQSLLNTEIGACIAETASIFGELLLGDRLVAEARTDAAKREVLAKILDEFGMAVFQVSARYFFETWLYEAVDRGEYLDGETAASYWTKARDRIYGDAVEWLDPMRWEWAMKVHYYIPRFRFYNYPYVYANLFVFALYRLYQEEGRGFAPKLKAILSAGSSRAPRDLAADLGFDIGSRKFWTLGMRQAEALLEELERLAPPGGDP